jgi:Ca2+-binding RTX toxin-like protein
MAKYFGHFYRETVVGANNEVNTFVDFGIGADTLVGGNTGNVFYLRVDEAVDTIWGSSSRDMVDYSGADRGVTIDLSGGTVSAVFGNHVSQVANLIGVESATGSNFADTIIGDTGRNTIDGGLGDDFLDGGAGASNVLSFMSHDLALAHQNEQFNICLGMNGNNGNVSVFGTVGGSFQLVESDTIRNFNDVMGSNHSENISGNEQDNDLVGLGGDDVINGFGGTDTLLGGSGYDRLIGSSGADDLLGGSEADTFVFVTTADSTPGAYDQIGDFEQGLDRIDVSHIDGSMQQFGFQHLAFTTAQTPGIGQIASHYDEQTGWTVVEARTNMLSSTPNFHLELVGHYNLSASDFIL